MLNEKERAIALAELRGLKLFKGERERATPKAEKKKKKKPTYED